MQATLTDLLPLLRQHRSILVTGPQRSGTTFAGHVLAHELGYRYADEDEARVDSPDCARKILSGDGVVLQAPGLCYCCHTFGDAVAVVMMRRPIEEIVASQQRISWSCELYELKKYGLTDGCISEVKYRAWDARQRHLCVSFDLDYHSLAAHPMWVDERKHFGHRQWKIEV